MKVHMSAVMLLIIVFAAFATMAFMPMTLPDLQVPEPTVFDVILRIAVGFTSLAGVSALVAVLVQIFKLLGLVKDGTAHRWTAGFNLIAFIVLVYFGVFQPSVAVSILDGYAAQIAQIALFVLGFVVQMATSKPVYSAFKTAQVPLLRYSLTK